MNISDILKTTAAVTGAVNPLLGAAIGVANQFLDKEDQIPQSATGAEVQSKIESLPPETRQQIYSKQIDLKIAQEEGWTERYKAMAAADGQTTRPQIALRMCNTLCFAVLAFCVLIFWRPGVLENEGVWVVFGTLTGVPATILMNYFGNLRREHAQRQETLGAAGTASGAVASLIKAFRK